MAAKIIKYFLGILSDATFLSSIEIIDFRNQYISIKRDFFNLCFTISNSTEKILKPRRFGALLKSLFLHRFTEVSATSLKKFFDKKIPNCFLDYLNVARYYSALLCEDKVDFYKFFHNHTKKRNFKYYEYKGYKYYLYCLNEFRNSSKQDQFNNDQHDNGNYQIDNRNQKKQQRQLEVIPEEDYSSDEASYLEEKDFEITDIFHPEANIFRQPQQQIVEISDHAEMHHILSLQSSIDSNVKKLYKMENDPIQYDDFDTALEDIDRITEQAEELQSVIDSSTNTYNELRFNSRG